MTFDDRQEPLRGPTPNVSIGSFSFPSVVNVSFFLADRFVTFSGSRQYSLFDPINNESGASFIMPVVGLGLRLRFGLGLGLEVVSSSVVIKIRLGYVLQLMHISFIMPVVELG